MATKRKKSSKKAKTQKNPVKVETVTKTRIEVELSGGEKITDYDYTESGTMTIEFNHDHIEVKAPCGTKLFFSNNDFSIIANAVYGVVNTEA